MLGTLLDILWQIVQNCNRDKPRICSTRIRWLYTEDKQTLQSTILQHGISTMLKKKKEKQGLLYSLRSPWLGVWSILKPVQAWVSRLDCCVFETARQGVRWALFKPIQSAVIWLGPETRLGWSPQRPWGQESPNLQSPGAGDSFLRVQTP